MDPNTILQLALLAVKAGTDLVIAFRHNSDGTVDISVTQTQTLDKLSAELTQASQWMSQHPSTK